MRKFEEPKSIALPEFRHSFDPSGNIRVSDPVLKDSRKGIFHLKFPDDLMARLPGSFADPSLLGGLFGIKDDIKSPLISDKLGSISKPLLTLSGKNTTLTVLHGSFNPLAVTVSKHAFQPLADLDNRGSYQKTVYEIVRSIVSKPNNHSLHIREDCIATGDSIIGLLEYSKHTHPNILTSGIRIDVVCATVQGITLLVLYAKASELRMEINIGYLAYGLSSGVRESSLPVPIHANYITYPVEVAAYLSEPKAQEIYSLKQQDGNCYVVGDMGDAFKSLPEEYDSKYPWNQFREDPHGDRNSQGPNLFGFRPGQKTAAYMANGGYFMRSLYRYVHPDETIGEWVVSAKRIWSDDPKYGYGVLINS